jgi:hypothetical protein
VWIKSGYYSFKFDRTEILGMIAPIWADSPTLGLPDPAILASFCSYQRDTTRRE